MRKRQAMKHASIISRPTLFLFLVIISIPLGSIYAGFAIGSYFAPNPSRLSDSEVVVSAAKLNFSWYNTHNITVDFSGGLGNYLFQYASLYGIARASGMKPVVPKAFKLYNIFPNLKAKSEDGEQGKQAIYSKFLEIKPGVFDSRTFTLNFMKNIKLYGFFQSWRYFDFTRNDIRRQFQFKSSIEEDVNKFLAAQRDDFKKRHSEQDLPLTGDKAVQFIGVHVRRGDYLDEKSIERGYSTPDIHYYNNAIKYFAKKYDSIIFVVCSDDIDWAKENIGPIASNAVFSPFSQKKRAETDLCLLSKCNHTIISVGTFGWWGAWLSAGTTIYFSKFTRPDSQISRTFNPGDYFIPQWIPM